MAKGSLGEFEELLGVVTFEEIDDVAVHVDDLFVAVGEVTDEAARYCLTVQL